MRGKDATVSPVLRVILASSRDENGIEVRLRENLRALVRALARQAARDYVESENRTTGTTPED